MTADEKLVLLEAVDVELGIARERTDAAFKLYRRNIENQRQLEEKRLQIVGVKVQATAQVLAEEHGQGPIPEKEMERVPTAPLGPIDPQTAK